MATEEALVVDRSKDMTIEDLREFSNIFSSEFNCSDIHDRVLCFEIIKAEELIAKDDSKDDCRSTISRDDIVSEVGEHKVTSTCEDLQHLTINDKNDVTEMTAKTEATAMTEDPLNLEYTTETADDAEGDKAKMECRSDQASDGTPELQDIQPNVCGDEKELQCQIEEQKNEEECDSEDLKSKMSEVADDVNKSILRKFFVHSQWLAVQSPYFKALFYSGMKETFSKEVIMKIYEHELEAHKALIEAMYKLDVLSDKNYCLVIQVLNLAHKYDVHHVFKKCKYVLLSTKPSLKMCEYILKEINHLSNIADIHEMLENFLVKEFSPMDETWTLDKFVNLSEAALRVLLRNDNLATLSENIIFEALMKWIAINIPCEAHNKCDLLDLVRFELMSADFLYDVVRDHIVASKMPGFNKYLVKGLAYHALSETRREQLEPKPKKRPEEIECPTFSWTIGEKLERKLTRYPETFVYSNRFLYRGYSMQLKLRFADNLEKCGFFFIVCDLESGAPVCVSYRAKSNLFAQRTIKIAKHLFTASEPDWGFRSLERNKALTEKCFRIDVWVEIHE